MRRKHTCLCLMMLVLPFLTVRVPAQSGAPGATGLLELPSAEKERILESFEVWEAAPTRAPLPARVVNTRYLPKVSSQGQLGICGSFAVYYYLYSYYFAKARNLAFRPDPATSPQHVFSPAWGVLMAPHGVAAEGGTGFYMPWGASPLACIESIINIGALPWSEMPYNDGAGVPAEDKFYRQLPTAAQMKAALRYKGVRGTTLNAIDTPDGLQNLKRFLAQGNIAVVTWRSPLTTNMDSYPNPSESVIIDGVGEIGNVNNNVYAWPSEAAGRAPSHAVTIIGYDDNIPYRNKNGEECQGALLLVNSWGTDWGVSPAADIEAGFMWLGYEAVLTYKKLEGQAYAVAARSEDYQPALLGTVTFQDQTSNNWVTQITGFPVRWPSLFSFSANRHPLGIEFPSNAYITKSNAAQPDYAEYLLDLSNMAGNPFPALALQCNALTTPDPVGKISDLKIERREPAGDNWTESAVPDVDFAVQRFSDSYPAFSAGINMLQEHAIGFEDLHPQAGSSAWGDASGDGFPDLAIASLQKKANGTLENIHRVYLNNGTGGFQANPIALPIPASEYPRSALCELLWVDIDNDGDLDIVAVNGIATYIVKNNGNATFNLSATLPYSGGPGAVASADFDLDGRPDLAIAGTSETGTVILFQTSPDVFTPYRISMRDSENVAMGIYAPAMAVGDINGDGLPDLVASGKEAGVTQNLIWYQNNGNYTFTPRQLPLPALPHFSIAIADFDGDGCDDILYSAGNNSGQHLNGVLRGRNEGLPTSVGLQSGLPPLWGGRVLWADLNNDGQPEALIGGIEDDGYATPSVYGYGTLDLYPRDQYYRHYTCVLTWDSGEQQFQDSGMTLHSTVGFSGPSILSAVDFDKDGDIDLLSGGVLTTKADFYMGQGPGADICRVIFLENRACGYFGDDRPNTPPSVPVGLHATANGNGKVSFSWTPSADDSTPAGALRYLLQAGTASGQYNLCSGNAPAGLPGQLLKSPVTLRGLPAGKIYWRVRAIDAGGKMSAWSIEQSVTASGSEAPPTPGEPLPEVAPPDVTITVRSLDTNGSTAGGYVEGGGGASSGSTILLKAFPRDGWRFSHWEGEVYSPLARKTKMLVFSDAVVTARFVPDHNLLHTAAGHTALRDRNGHIWAWSDTFSEAKTGPAWLQAEDGLPALAAVGSQSATWLGVNDTRTFFGVSNGEHDTPDDDNKNFLRDSLMTVKGLDDFSWWSYSAYPEKTLAMWCSGNGYIVNHLGTNAAELDTISFYGSSASIHPSDWIVSQHDPNLVNLGIAQVACTDSFVLFLTHQAGVYAVGSNHCGQLGDNTTNAYADIAAVPGMPKFKAIAAGWDSDSQTAFALGLDFQGRVWSWGNNDYGQLGRGNQGGNVLSPQILPAFSSPVIALAAGNRHALVLTADDRVFAWGDNLFGQIGSGDVNGDGVLDQTIVTSPYKVPSLGTVICIAAADAHSLAMTDDGKLFGWGNNGCGQITGNSSADLWIPTPVPNPPTWQGSDSTLTTSVRSSADTPGSSTSYPGMGSVIPPAGTYPTRSGSTLPIKAINGERYQFSHWEGPVADPNNPETTLLLEEGDIQVCAVFTLSAETLALNISANPADAGSTLPALGEYELAKDSVQTFRALPKPQYAFKQWDSVTDLDDLARQSQFDWTLTGDLNLTAQFELRPFRTSPKPNIEGTTLSLTENGQIIWWTSKSNVYSQHTLDLGGVRILDVISKGLASVGNGLALGDNGRLYAWGNNSYGERGAGTAGSGYTYPDAYNLVLGPDGQALFTDAVRIFAGQHTRFAQCADGNLYVWGKMPVSGQSQPRPIQVPGLKDNAKVLDVIEATETSISTFLFLYDDGTVASWGDADFTGTGNPHPIPTQIPGLSNIRAVTAGNGVALALGQNGNVYVWGKSYAQNYTGCLGLGTNIKTQILPRRLTNLPVIKRIFVIGCSCYAIDQGGKLWIWGQNGWSYWHGVGSTEPTAYFTPTQHPNANQLPEFVSITGGNMQVVALTSGGELWKWGRGAHEYDLNQFQPVPGGWPNAARDETFGTYSVEPYTHCRVELLYDALADDLVSWPSGVYTLMAGQNVTLHAASAPPGRVFQRWLKNGEQISQNPFLELPVNASFRLEAVYAIQAPVLELEDTGADSGAVAAMPLFLRSAYTAYEAFDLQIRFPDTLRFRGIDTEQTQMTEESISSFWIIPATETRDGLAEVRIIVHHPEAVFTAGNTPLAKLQFELPWASDASYTITLMDVTDNPALSRHYGTRADKTAGDYAQIRTETTVVQEEFSSGWMFYTPFGTSPCESLADWADALALQGIDISPVAWVWDAAGNRWVSSTELLPNQPLMLFVERSGFNQAELDQTPFSTTLHPGWNLLSVPQELPIPDDAVIIFAIGKTCCEMHHKETLQPNTLYWVFREADAKNYPP
jgi:alpha-tubulin suppressor-like RCC1 family protein